MKSLSDQENSQIKYFKTTSADLHYEFYASKNKKESEFKFHLRSDLRFCITFYFIDRAGTNHSNIVVIGFRITQPYFDFFC
jgi:hypothetical protein